MASAFSPDVLKVKSVAEEIVEILQRDIIGGAFQAGQRLLERELILRFGVSSIPIREALQELQNRGLVLRRHNCGCSVIRLTRGEASRICDLRRVLEPRVMEWAAARMTPDASEQMRDQLKRMQTAAEVPDQPVFFQEDLKFHRMLWAAADNIHASRALETVMGSLFASGIIDSRRSEPIDLRVEVDKHRRLLDAICDGDGQRAALSLLEIAAGFEKHLAHSQREI